jgi:hypothetical protein
MKPREIWERSLSLWQF